MLKVPHEVNFTCPMVSQSLLTLTSLPLMHRRRSSCRRLLVNWTEFGGRCSDELHTVFGLCGFLKASKHLFLNNLQLLLLFFLFRLN